RPPRRVGAPAGRGAPTAPPRGCGAGVLRRARMAVSVRDDARPLAGTLEELTALYTYLDARAADGPPTGWITAEALAAPGLPHLSDLVAAVTVATGTTDRQIGVSFFLNGYAWLVAAAALGCY